MATPSLPVKPVSTWKRLAIVSFFGGVGFALALAVILGSFAWYKSRPKPWNSQIIKAKFDKIEPDYDQKSLLFFYVLENEGNFDFRIENASGITLTGKLAQEGALSDDYSYVTIRAFPAYVPAQRKSQIALKLPFPFADECHEELTRPQVDAKQKLSTQQTADETIETLSAKVKSKYKSCQPLSDVRVVENVVSFVLVKKDPLQVWKAG